MSLHMKSLAFFMLFASCRLFAVGSVININGELISGSCEVSGSPDFTVDLGTQDIKILRKNQRSSPVVFMINLKECGPAAAAAKVAFSGTENTARDGLLKTDDIAESASGFAIQILDDKDEMIPVNGDINNIKWRTIKPSQDNQLVYNARIYAAETTNSPGKISASVAYLIEYQ